MILKLHFLLEFSIIMLIYFVARLNLMNILYFYKKFEYFRFRRWKIWILSYHLITTCSSEIYWEWIEKIFLYVLFEYSNKYKKHIYINLDKLINDFNDLYIINILN